MSKWFVAVVALVVALPMAGRAQVGRGRGRGAPPRSVAGHGIDVPGWWARVDNPRDATGSLKLVSDGGMLHAMTGPAAIFWDPQQTASGQYTVKAKFTLSRMPRFEEAYGLFIGGSNLDKDNERFTAFVVREDGSYAIRQRRGMPASPATVAWMTNAAIMRPDASRHQTNELSIHVGADTVTFMVNGKEVARRPASQVDTSGIAGLRVNNNLDVQVAGFAIEKMPAGKMPPKKA